MIIVIQIIQTNGGLNNSNGSCINMHNSNKCWISLNDTLRHIKWCYRNIKNELMLMSME